MKMQTSVIRITLLVGILFSLAAVTDFAEAQTGSLSGVVRSGTTLVNKAQVRLSPGTRTETSNFLGVFSFSDLPVGEYTIRVTASGYQTWNGSKTIIGGINVQDVELTPLVATGSLTGVVRSGATLVGGALVSLSPGNLKEMTNMVGTFSFSDLPAGDYAITVTADGYEPWSGSKTIVSGTNLQDVELTPLVETGSLTGAVRSGATLISGALVALSPGGYEAITSIAGTFNFADLPVGDYAITVTAAGYQPWSGSKTVASGINVQDVELTAVSNEGETPETGSLSGVVRSGLTFVSGAVVSLSPGGYEATTSIAGTFNFADLPVGDYAITVTAAGYEPWSGSKTVGSGINLQDVELTPAGKEGESEGESEGELEGEPEGEPEGEEAILHPADLNDDWRIVLSEAIAYLSGWQQGSNPLGYAIRAAYLWQNGELYAYDPANAAPMCWVLAQ